MAVERSANIAAAAAAVAEAVPLLPPARAAILLRAFLLPDGSLCDVSLLLLPTALDLASHAAVSGHSVWVARWWSQDRAAAGFFA
jgi:hypothetical protein